MSYIGDFYSRPNAPTRRCARCGRRTQPPACWRGFLRCGHCAGAADEPTNDLDIDTLELLRELLQNYAGTVVPGQPRPAFSGQRRHQHDCWEGDPEFGGRTGLWREYEGGYEDWKQQRERSRVQPVAAGAARAEPRRRRALNGGQQKQAQLQEQRELDRAAGADRSARSRTDADRRSPCQRRYLYQRAAAGARCCGPARCDRSRVDASLERCGALTAR